MYVYENTLKSMCVYVTYYSTNFLIFLQLLLTNTGKITLQKTLYTSSNNFQRIGFCQLHKTGQLQIVSTLISVLMVKPKKRFKVPQHGHSGNIKKD